MNRRNALFLVVLGFLLTTSALAQMPKLSKEASAQLKKEIKQYQQENITPFIQAKRLELENKLSPVDKKELDQIRTQLATYHQHRKAQLQQLREKRQQKEPLLTKEAQEAFSQQRAHYRAQMEKLALLTKRYEKPLTAIETELESKWDLWKQELNAISEKYSRDQLTAQHPVRVKLVQQAMKNYFWNAGRFLLMVPGEADSSEEDMADEAGSLAPAGPKSSLRLSPNPALDKAQLFYALSTAGQVRVELVNQQGKVIEQVMQQNQKAGAQQLPVNVSQLQNGIYFYRVTSANRTETLRFLKQ